MKKTGLYWYAYDVEDNLNIHKYLMKKKQF